MEDIVVLNRNKVFDNILWGDINGPTYCYLEITRKCNCACQYCQVGDSFAKDIDLNLFKLIIDKLFLSNAFEIRLGGGEPLLNSKIFEMLEYINTKNIAVWVCTNGTLLTKEMCKKLYDYGVVGVRVSIDSLNYNIHNKIRGLDGCLSKALIGLKNAKDSGLKPALCMTIGKHNISEFESLKKYALDNGYDFFPHFIMPIGKGISFLNENALEDIKKINKLDMEDGEKNCMAVSQTISIDINGGVSPCSFIEPVINIRNIEEKNVLECSLLQKFTFPTPTNKCKKCEFNCTKKAGKCIVSSICKGGCWALYEQNK